MLTAQATGGEAHARATLERMVQKGELPGAQYVAVSARHGLVDLHLGLRDVLGARPMERDTLQMAYSLTKVVTAMAVMQLAEQGKLGLDQPLSESFPEHPYGSAVTVRMLLAHTAGVPNPLPLDWFALAGEPLDRDARLRALLARSKSAAEPGARHLYSNVGYWLLEKVIEAASGMDYAAYLQAHLFAPLGLSPAMATFELPVGPAAAVGHARRFTPMNAVLWALTPSRYWSTPHGGWSRGQPLRPHGRAYGGLFTSAGALAVLLQDLLQDRPRSMSASSRAEMLSTQHTRDGKSTGESLGWVTGTLHGTPYFGKQGGGFGFHGNVRIYPELGLATAFLANRTEISPGPIDARSDALDAGFVRGLA